MQIKSTSKSQALMSRLKSTVLIIEIIPDDACILSYSKRIIAYVLFFILNETFHLFSGVSVEK